MNKPASTLGSWRVDVILEDQGLVKIDAAGQITIIAHAYCYEHEDHGCGQEAIANGHLIAAAPDLYEALAHCLMTLIEWESYEEGPCGEDHQIAVKKATDALSKASPNKL